MSQDNLAENNEFNDEPIERLNLSSSFTEKANSIQSGSNSKSQRSDGMGSTGRQSDSDGVLTEALIEECECLSNLNKTADGTSYAYLELTASSLGLCDISVLADYEQLQVLNLSHNQLTSLSAISGLVNLVQLDASHNRLRSAFDFGDALGNLRSADLSHNEIADLPDMTAFGRLRDLDLSHNRLSEVPASLMSCASLQHLNLGHNCIARLCNLDCLPLATLNLEHNSIERIENLDSLDCLQSLVLSANRIESLAGLEGLQLLQILDLADNKVLELLELRHVKDLRLLRQLNLARNPVQDVPDYRLLVIFDLPRLTHLDGRRVTIKEKVQAENQENPSMEIVAQRDHRLNLVYSYFQPHYVLDSTLQSAETPYPMLVLVGPNGSMKKDLAQRLVSDFPEYFGYGVSTTTRPPYPDEDPERDYHFVTAKEFEELQVGGKFIQTALFQGHYFGLTLEAVEAVAREGLACVVHMELEGVLALKKTHFEPRYVLTMPLDRHRHGQHLRTRPERPEQAVLQSMARAQLYIRHNQQHPGFFDMFINTDEPSEAYVQLRTLVMNYLGLTGEAAKEEQQQQQRSDDFASSGKTLNRTWSKTSQQSSVFNPLRPSAPQTSGKGQVEEESLHRRRSLARETVSSGKPQGRVTMATPGPLVSTRQPAGGGGAASSSQESARTQQQAAAAAGLQRLELGSSDSGQVRSSNPKAPRSRSRAGAEAPAGATTYSPAMIEA
ncbi:hypothetical protein BOX15_Mlig004996g2 [Macrostomum lignano]|uniref:Uncharacterized protein n=2 Tax=Macrostomum lignano TaxID=282301 RepID=A0A267EAB8_9PLAT|nr:hypothetical protein BOX15_Mlig004996g1 [Macrostomum lignano]PAA84639.1 hypothetical protein BOX15_Mlig004996g2 [Macrostomum lignano]